MSFVASSPRQLAIVPVSAAMLAASLGLPVGATDLPPDLVARFARQVQPLLLNRCGAGACHGGPRSHEPWFHRAGTGGAIGRPATLDNAGRFLALLGPDGDPQPLARLLAVRHPANAQPRHLALQPLTPRERAVLEGWLVDARLAVAQRQIVDPAVTPAAHAAASDPPHPNRFRALLEAAANPPPMPPPQEPQGIILGRDEPPAE